MCVCVWNFTDLTYSPQVGLSIYIYIYIFIYIYVCVELYRSDLLSTGWTLSLFLSLSFSLSIYIYTRVYVWNFIDLTYSPQVGLSLSLYM